MGMGFFTLRIRVWMEEWMRRVSLMTFWSNGSFSRSLYWMGGRSVPRALICSLYNFSVISGSEASRSIIQQLIADEECWPAMSKVIII